MKIVLKSKKSYIIKKGGEKRMRYSKVIFAFSIGIFLIATMAFLSNIWAAEDVRKSKHNLSASRTIDGNVTFSDTTEVCVFCHTPHGGRTDVAGGAAPIWNRASSTADYTDFVYKSPNFDAAGNTPGYPKGVSIACLSCHDGTVAFDALINLPGSGGYRGTNPVSAGYDRGSSTLVDTDNTFNEAAEPFPNLGIDLRNDHPISMEIPATDPQFTEIIANLKPGELSAGRISPLYRGADSTLPGDKRDQVRAYPTVGDKAYIECASCHNPHENTSTRFLRYPSFVGTPEEIAIGAGVLNADRNAGSLLCLTCHQK